ncbi:MAG: shikimate dehydrogenase [Sphingopyxis macrogoltabida]|uniref:Shikimate dehydrogenase (NADP(+)) n=1 Tax=Sphingopyxis macrogoltabida TaxID=33050 RepID=A0A2W5L460_SPHMC|nr:MAG: shikimate dehydrogenase [Sphingopyxis macrogoltabida]
MTGPYAEVIGDPIAHSKSPLIHGFWLQALGIDGDYRRTHVTPGDLPAYIEQRRADPDWRGCNVTIPHKLAVMDLVDDPGDIRGTIGAMNTVVRQPGGALIGTNTDAAGFYAPLAETDLTGAPVAVVGAGGAARAVLFALARAGVGHVTILNRSPLKAMGLLATFGLKGDVAGLDTPLPPAALLVNASSLGMTGQPPLDIDLSPLPADAIVYDLVYAPLQTCLLKAAEARGLGTVDGLDMLIGQAALAFELFFGRSPPEGRDDELRALLTA